MELKCIKIFGEYYEIGSYLIFLINTLIVSLIYFLGALQTQFQLFWHLRLKDSNKFGT